MLCHDSQQICIYFVAADLLPKVSTEGQFVVCGMPRQCSGGDGLQALVGMSHSVSALQGGCLYISKSILNLLVSAFEACLESGPHNPHINRLLTPFCRNREDPAEDSCEWWRECGPTA